jgi:hypothetical protein
MIAPDATFDEARFAALAERLGIPARQLLIAAARLAESGIDVADSACVDRLLEDARNGSAAADEAARLLLTPIGDYAINEVQVLFAGIWPGSAERRDR